MAANSLMNGTAVERARKSDNKDHGWRQGLWRLSVLAVMLLAMLGVLAPNEVAAKPAKKAALFCGFGHYVRESADELGTSALNFRNANTTATLNIERLIIRNSFGDVVHDSTMTDHPENTDFVPPLNISVVPPGANYYLSSQHIFGSGALSAGQGGNVAASAMTAVVVYSTKGDPKLISISASFRLRDRTTSEEHSRGAPDCRPMPSKAIPK